MTIEDFCVLTPVMKTQTIRNNGALLCVRRELEVDIVLYQLDCFYVEVYFDQTKDPQSKFRSFENTDELQPYLSTIDITVITDNL